MGVGDPGDRGPVDPLVIDVIEMGGDVAGREALRVERDHHLVQPREPTLAHGHRGGFEAAVAIPWDLHLDVADLGAHGLGVMAVPGVSRAPPLHAVAFIAEMIGDLGLQRPLQDPADQPSQQAAFASERDTGRLGLLDEPLGGLCHQRVGRQRQLRRRGHLTLGARHALRCGCHRNDPSWSTAAHRGPSGPPPVTHTLHQPLVSAVFGSFRPGGGRPGTPGRMGCGTRRLARSQQRRTRWSGST